jgi:hypothetical protein
MTEVIAQLRDDVDRGFARLCHRTPADDDGIVAREVQYGKACADRATVDVAVSATSSAADFEAASTE